MTEPERRSWKLERAPVPEHIETRALTTGDFWSYNGDMAERG
jgi:hypothetical protein